MMFKWLFHIFIFATCSGKYQNKEKPLKPQRILRLRVTEICLLRNAVDVQSLLLVRILC